MNLTAVGAITPEIGSTVSRTGVTARTHVTAIPVGGATGIYTVDTASNITTGQTLNTTVPNIYDGGWAASSPISCSNVAVRSWGNGVIGAWI
jgi:hypothetical protein